MSCYISSNENRFYAEVESVYGHVAGVTSANRFPAVKLTARQTVVSPMRKDKTGSRTFAGLPSSVRRQTSFELNTYLASSLVPGTPPGYGALVQGALGGEPSYFSTRQKNSWVS